MPVKTPCVGRCTCTLGDDVCKGCGRTAAEVRDWNGYTDAKKLSVTESLQRKVNEMIDFDKYAKEIHEQNKAVGWWDDPDRNVLETLQLISTEIAEATEGERKNLMDDHLPHRKMGEVELADTLIRLLDVGGRCEIKFRHGCVSVSREVEGKEIPVGAMHFFLNRALVTFGCSLGDSFGSFRDEIVARNSYSSLARGIVSVAESQGYDVEAAMIEKMEYNRSRADHKRDNRAKPHGKRF